MSDKEPHVAQIGMIKRAGLDHFPDHSEIGLLPEHDRRARQPAGPLFLPGFLRQDPELHAPYFHFLFPPFQAAPS